MKLNELQIAQEALERLSIVLDCSVDEILDCLEGQLMSEEECAEIRFSLED